MTPEITMEVLDQKIVAIFDRRFGSAAVGRFHQLWSFPDEKNRAIFHTDTPTRNWSNKQTWRNGWVKKAESSPQTTTLESQILKQKQGILPQKKAPQKIAKSSAGGCWGLLFTVGILMEKLPRGHERHFHGRAQEVELEIFDFRQIWCHGIRHFRQAKSSIKSEGGFLWTVEL